MSRTRHKSLLPTETITTFVARPSVRGATVDAVSHLSPSRFPDIRLADDRAPTVA
ncbi:hypothetical protein SNOG_00204 [Parastagonospora nodorum SN15]|uniref:Uncharacterized protein n=1 Tax=Phaeosphaeria nodorum (strain SN15 / ATCC MYA-4574 / FGSC 10173) TaxID=321614 RepID=Q0V710_PHANO|nr:hypothetical protein SNOG_00204 [Parastagonospora nodorum SN15]EAT91699.1 hypothetical protein SNOG_00204 [Parastagonospora nodorum SN15]